MSQNNSAHINSAYEKVLKGLRYNFSTDAKYYPKGDFCRTINTLQFTAQEIRSYDPNREAKNKYDLVKKILANFAIDLYLEGDCYVLKPNNKIFELIACLISTDENKKQNIYNTPFFKEASKFDGLVQYRSLVNEITDLQEKNNITADEKKILYDYLDDLMDEEANWPTIDDLFTRCNIKPRNNNI